LWHQLGCRGKYAGEVRIEITYYDSRPKPEKPVLKPKEPAVLELETGGASAQPRGAPNRRPLPSGPAPALPPAPQLADPAQTTPKSLLNQPGQPAQTAAYISNQSPLQQIEYGAPPPNQGLYQEPDHYSPAPSSGGYGTPSRRMDSLPQQYRTPERHDRLSGHADDRDYSPSYPSHPYDRQKPQTRYSGGQDHYGMSPSDDSRRMFPDDDDRPPPPPAHRSRNNSGAAHDAPYWNAGPDANPPRGTPPTMRHDVLRNEAHRHSTPITYSGRLAHKGYDSAPPIPLGSQFSQDDAQHPSPPRYHSYDSGLDRSYRPLQPTVEDVPESPSHENDQFRRSGHRMPRNDDVDFGQVPSPAPLNLSGRASAVTDNHAQSPLSIQHRHHASDDYPSSISSTSRADFSNPTRSPQNSGPTYDQEGPAYRSELDDTSNSYWLPPVPPSLVPGVDPGLALEISNRINEDRRQTRRYTQPPPSVIATPSRDRQTSDSPPRSHGQDSSPMSYGTPQQSYGRSPITYSGGPNTPDTTSAVKPGAVVPGPSPTTQITIRRKSISPAPPMDTPNFSGVPYGPDSYNALNPSMSKDKDLGRPDYDEESDKIITHDGREIDPSDHLPMESWAPEPEPKQKKDSAPPSSRPSPSGAQPLPPSGRRRLRLAARPHSMSVAPSSTASTTYYASEAADPPTPSPPVNTGRNRLQKRAHRASAMPIMSGGSSPGNPHGSGPLTPLPPHQDNYTPPRALTRASTSDYPNENYEPTYGGSPGGTRSRVKGPPIPAKVPLVLPAPPGPPMMSGALPVSRENDGYGGGNDRGMGSMGRELSLAEEMRMIDIGEGRARRHGHSGYWGQGS
jgi:hypothetical protein